VSQAEAQQFADIEHLPVLSENISGHTIESFGAPDFEKPLERLGFESMAWNLSLISMANSPSFD
jgi:hypothetical protein